MPSLLSNALPRPMPPTPLQCFKISTSNNQRATRLPSFSSLGYDPQVSNFEPGRLEPQQTVSQYQQHAGPSSARSAHFHKFTTHACFNYPDSQLASPTSYGAAKGSAIPPVRVMDPLSNDYQQTRKSKRANAATQSREEKPTGGVATHLDYEVEDMVDFVSQTAQGMYDIYASRICLADIHMTRSVVCSKTRVHPDFRKYVLQVLSSTRLPSSTILLGLHYLAERMILLSASGNFNEGTGQVYRMLTTALLLGSKFLDDNTFQNRSWSEVSNISVLELNALEIEWLMAINWNMHISLDNPEGFLFWHQSWQRFNTNRIDRSLAHTLKQTALEDGHVQTHSSVHRPSPSMPYVAPSYADGSVSNNFKNRSQSQWFSSRYHWPPLPSKTDHSPPSAPETGPNTPEWYTVHGGLGFSLPAQQIYPTLKMPPSLHILGSNASQHTPNSQYYNHYGHGSACGCRICIPYHERCVMAPGYGPQPVIG